MFKVGQLLYFNIYGTNIEGTFVRMDDYKVIIKTTKDFLGDLGSEQSINKGHLITTAPEVQSSNIEDLENNIVNLLKYVFHDCEFLTFQTCIS